MMKKGGSQLRGIYHWVVSINRPSGYEPDALPLRHDDFVCPHHTHINISVAFKLFTNIL